MNKNLGLSSIPRKFRNIFFGIAVAMSALIIAFIFFIIFFGQMNQETIYLKQMIAVLGMMFAMILFVGCCFNIRDNKRQGYRFALISLLVFLTIFMSGVLDTLEGNREFVVLLFIFESIITVFCAIIHLLLWFYQCNSLPKNRAQRYFTWWIYALTLFCILFVIVNIFTGVEFYVDASGHFVWSGQTIEFVTVALYYLSYLIYVIPQQCSRKKKIAVASLAIFPIIILLLEIMWYFIGIKTTIISIAYVFLLLTIYVLFFCDYSESRELFLLQKAEMVEQAKEQTELQTALMLSQIRPHFLYNTLTAIRNLCKHNPQDAYAALGGFADYLRSNMEFLGDGRIIPFVKELEHIKTYLTLEQIRFGDDLKVEFDIGYKDFVLPALTVQPIVENAVRHGATMNENGGIVRICTKKSDKIVEITVSDNGPGFNPDEPPTDGKSHFGLSNVRNCLEADGRGKLRIESSIGSGTTVTILINDEISEQNG